MTAVKTSRAVVRLLPVLLVLAAATGCKKREPIHVDQQGTIAPGDQVLQQDNSLYDDYPIDVAAGSSVRVKMTSDAFDTYLMLMDPQGNRVAFNDDDASLGGNGTNSQFTFTTTVAGVHHVYANAYKAGEQGAYRIQIDATPPAQ